MQVLGSKCRVRVLLLCPPLVPTYDFSRARWEEINDFLAEIPWEAIFLGLRNIEEMYYRFLVYFHKSMQMFVSLRRPRQAKKYRTPPSFQPLLAKKHFVWQEGCFSGVFIAFK